MRLVLILMPKVIIVMLVIYIVMLKVIILLLLTKLHMQKVVTVDLEALHKKPRACPGFCF